MEDERIKTSDNSCLMIVCVGQKSIDMGNIQNYQTIHLDKNSNIAEQSLVYISALRGNLAHSQNLLDKAKITLANSRKNYHRILPDINN
ncbi:MAG: hypothetical protein PHR00_01240 [Patescibacteria group bacterium]|nr:hypothetical protein [Patescibacteria group bacterium]